MTTRAEVAAAQVKRWRAAEAMCAAIRNSGLDQQTQVQLLELFNAYMAAHGSVLRALNQCTGEV